MSNEHEIGRVVAVDTAQVTVELNRDLKALTRSTYEGTIEVGRINSYIIIPVGSRRIVAMVTKVNLTEESEIQADKMMVSLPSTRRLMKATMIGSIDDNQFRQGISLFPVLDTKVFLTTKDDLDAIFCTIKQDQQINPEKPGYCIPIGKSVVFPDYTIRIDPDAFFGKHAAIIGSTGSGKSCSIATILQSIISMPQIKQTRIVILDTNGEYRAAFQIKQDNGEFINALPERKTLYIPTDASDSGKLVIPYWFMNSDDFVRLFRASPGVQRPVLLNALSNARLSATANQGWLQTRDTVIGEFNHILALCTSNDKSDARTIRQRCDEMIKYLNSDTQKSSIETLLNKYPDLGGEISLQNIFDQIKNISREGIKDEGVRYELYAPIGADKKQRIESIIRPLIKILAPMLDEEGNLSLSSADCPSYFSKQSLRYEHLDNSMSRDESQSTRTRDNCSTMIMRIYRLLEDTRFEFLFGPNSSEWPGMQHALATFIRDVLGMQSGTDIELTDTGILPNGLLPFYDRQRNVTDNSNVVIVDLSLLASEVLENVTALIGRLIHEFLQRLSDPVSGIGRGEFPVVLVLEEAQNYIRENRKLEEESISKEVFERIAREGRKFGLGLVVASQRPSELSKTVLSQCNSFIVHRLQNPEDLRYFREIVPGIYNQLLDQLPALAPRCALILGECVQAPVLVEMREVDPAPQSRNPKFFKSWVSENTDPNIEAICSKWEGMQIIDIQEHINNDEKS